MESVRVDSGDLTIPIDLWPLPYEIPLVHRALKEPLTFLPSADRLSSALLDRKDSPSDLIDTLAPLLVSKPFPALSAPRETVLPASLPEPLRGALDNLLTAIGQAQETMRDAVSPFSADERRALLSFFNAGMEVERITLSPISEPRYRTDLRTLSLLRKFNMGKVLAASGRLAQAVEACEPSLRNDKGRYNALKTQRIQTPIGLIVVGSTGSDRYDARACSEAVLILDLGGNNVYEGPAAAAKEGQVRLVVDFGKRVRFQSEQASAGSGRFGIGMAFLLNPEGRVMIESGDFSQGCGFFGTGLLYLRSRKTKCLASSYSQGAAAFGLGVLCDARSEDSSYHLDLFGQGAAFTRGVGLLLNGKGHSRWEAGFKYHDFREPEATESLAQGAAMGFRGYAAGGIGLAVIGGGENTLEADYFAQGSAYGRSLASLWIGEAQNRLSARRYAQGAGVHMGAGALILKRGLNEIDSWWASQGAAWDFSVGALSISGEGKNRLIGNGFRSQADGGSISFVELAGPSNEWGGNPGPANGEFSEWSQRPGYAFFSSMEKIPRMLRNPTPWSCAVGDFAAKPGLLFKSKKRPLPSRTGQERAEESRFDEQLEDSTKLPDLLRISEWLEVASTVGLATKAPAKAKKNLLSLPPREIRRLVEVADHPSTDVQILLRELIPLSGRAAVERLIPQARGVDERRALTALSLLDRLPNPEAVQASLVAAGSKSVLRQIAGARVLGGSLEKTWLDRLRGLDRVLSVAGPPSNPEAAIVAVLSGADRINILGLVGLHANLTAEEKTVYDLDGAGSYEPASPKLLQLAAHDIASHAAQVGLSLHVALKHIEHQRLEAVKILQSLWSSAEPEVRHAAIAALGKIGDSKAIPGLIRFLNDPTALVRESARAALSKIGPAAVPALQESLKSPNAARTRALAALALSTIKSSKTP